MKKEYIQPSISTHIMELANIICTSGTPGFGSGTANTDTEQDGGGFMLSRRHSFWEDED